MVDALDSKSSVRKGVWVRVPPPVPCNNKGLWNRHSNPQPRFFCLVRLPPPDSFGVHTTVRTFPTVDHRRAGRHWPQVRITMHTHLAATRVPLQCQPGDLPPMAESKSCLNILLVDDEQIIHDTLCDYLTELGHHVDSAFDGKAGIEATANKEYHVALVDIRMPRLDGLTLLAALHESRPELAVVIMTGHGDMETAIQALRLGAADFLPKPVKLLDLDAVLAKAQRLHELSKDRSHLRAVVGGLQRARDTIEGPRRLVGVSAAMVEVRQQIQQAVEGGAESILITGETGTGKDVVAREIHALGGSQDHPFIAASCPSLPEALVEAELFGHVKGAFTGADKDRPGYFELAHGGTLFLDEVGDLAAPAQATLLRVLETRTVRRVGGAREIAVDLRVVAATNARLDDDSVLRRDLLYRLNLFTIHLQPLRQHPEDILPLAEHFLSSYGQRRKVQFDGFTTSAAQALQAHSYPGNARELRNTVERAAMFARGGLVDVEHLSMPQAGALPPAPISIIEGDERSRITQALQEARWNRREAANLLAMPYSTLRYKIQKLGIA